VKILTLGSVVVTLACAFVAPAAYAQEVAECRSTNPADWPAPSKPYFLLAVDASTSMSTAIASNSCGYSATRNGGARCAVFNTVRAFSGLVNFGLLTFPRAMFPETVGGSGPATCPSVPTSSMTGCNVASLYNDTYGTTSCTGCGAVSLADFGAASRGANILVPLQQDNYWAAAAARTASNVSEILAWVDNSCGDCREIWADGGTPLNGLLRDAYRYLSTQWTRPGPDTTSCTRNSQCNDGLRCQNGNCEDVWPPCDATHPCPAGTTCSSGLCVFPTPLTGTERPCRSVNLVLVTDGEEWCDASNYCNSEATAGDASDAAADLLTGFTVGGVHWSVRTHVIALATFAGVDNIARSGGTGQGYVANNEAELSAALANIVSSAIPPEVCDNADNNCNGCTDEGFRTYCNRGRQPVASPTNANQCCQWANATARAACLTTYRNSITSSNPQGNRWLLPCWDPATDAASPQTKWLCVDPGEVCDERDNNCETSWNLGANPPPNNQVDEGFRKCAQDVTGTLECPTTEVCDGIDNDCDGIRDNVFGTSCQICQPSPEVCDGRDNDCDAQVDEDLPTYECGLPSPAPAWCRGQRSCQNGAYTTCSWSPRSEADYGCNGIDDNCNGIIDDGISGEPCVPAGTTGLVFYDPVLYPYTRCRKGEKACGSSDCVGGVGPLAGGEVCNGLDDDCDGSIDECDGPTVTLDGRTYCPSLGEGNDCGSAVGACRKGHTQCLVVPGASYLDCGGGTGPTPERCDGVDSDCDGVPDDQDTLVDAPFAPGCWNKPVTDLDCDPDAGTCEQGALTWCAPPGAACQALGALASPCAMGTLACVGGMWVCQGGRLPGTEVCDGADNDCDGAVDDNLGPPVGLSCGIARGLCTTGVNYCDNGVIRCTGQGPVPEICDGLDNDCDGTLDNGLGLGDACSAAVDATLYPGDRTLGDCRPGLSQCDPLGSGTNQCVGGVGPRPEICDGLDNDCDGRVDEPGPAPNGIDGTPDPDEPDRHIGDPCGTGSGVCQLGRLTCVQGQVICAGGLASQVETCDCADNDCDGVVDEDPGATEPRLCSPGKTCVRTSKFCVCAETCAAGEFPCPTASSCQHVPRSGTADVGDYCVPDDPCGDCSTQTRTDANLAVECAPAGTLVAGKPVPVCVCKGQAGCHSPCYNVVCTTGQACVPTGTFQGQCQPANDCTFFGCPAGELCSLGACVHDPCSPNPCAASEVCKPTSSFADHRCVRSCAGVTCAAAERCVEGDCVATGCPAGCLSTESCQPSGDGGFACQPSRCILADGGTPCPSGGVCDPVTGQCGNDPCTGVVCPAGQACRDNECVIALPSTDGGVGGATGTGGSGGGGPLGGGRSGSAAGTGGSGAVGAAPPSPHGVWGLATGGGGCSCRTSAPSRAWQAGLACILGAWLFARRRKRPGATSGSRGGVR
jgi:hypothetical protein